MSVRNLPYVQVDLSSGLASNIRPEETSGRFLRQAINVDAFAEYRSVGKIPGSTRVSADHGSAVKGLHHFDHTGLDGVRRRHQLSLNAAGALQRIESNLSLTSLATGLSGEQLRDVNVLSRLYLTGPLQLALPTGGLVYDGVRTTNWGLLAPGEQQTVREALNAAAFASWTGSADVTVSAEATASRGGSGSVAVAKTGTSSTSAYIDRTGLAHNWSASDRARVWVFLPSGTLQKLATSGAAVQVRYGGAGLTDSNFEDFALGDLVPGWNELLIELTDPSGVTGGGATLSLITDIRLLVIFSATSQTQSGIFWNKLYTLDLGKPTAADGGAGAVTGTRTYRVAFLGERGNVSNGGQVSNSITVSARQISLTAVPVSADPQCLARKIYADVSGDRLYRFVGQIDDNTTTTFTDNVTDSSLGSADLPLPGDANFDASIFGPMRDVAYFNSRIFGISATDPTQLLVGDINSPDSRRLIDEVSMDVEMIALRVHPLGLVIYSNDQIHVLTGDGIDTPFDPVQATDQFGANGVRSVTQVKGVHVAVREEDVFAIINPADPWPLNAFTRDDLEGIAAGAMSEAFWIADRSRFRVIGFVQSAVGGSYNTILVYQYATKNQSEITGQGAGTDPHDIRIGAWYKLSLPSSVNPQCAVLVERSAEKPELWIGGNDGYVYWLTDPAATAYAAGVSSEGVEATIETVGLRLGEDVGGRGTPRYLQLHAVTTVESTWVLTVTLLSDVDGREIASVSRDIVFPVGKSSPLVTIPFIGARGEWCRLKLTNSTTGEDGRFRVLTLYYTTRNDFRGPRTA